VLTGEAVHPAVKNQWAPGVNWGSKFQLFVSIGEDPDGILGAHNFICEASLLVTSLVLGRLASIDL